MLSKETLTKIAVAVLVVALIWFILKRAKGNKRRGAPQKVIVTPMPGPMITERFEDGEEDDEEEEGFEEEEEGYDEDIAAEEDFEEGYAEWQDEEDEGFEGYADANDFKSDLLD